MTKKIDLDKLFLFGEKQFEAFDKLCYKAKELIYLHLVDGKKYMGDKHTILNSFLCHVGEMLDLTPIEQIFQVAFEIYVDEYNRKFGETIDIFCFSQEEITKTSKKYVVDFLINGGEQTLYTEKDAIIKQFELTKPLVIECDGYDYHSNKEQMENDYNREIDLKNAGYDVIRFTGSQIYKNPLDCAEQIFYYVVKNSKIIFTEVLEKNGEEVLSD